jgi:predicted nucleic acid-binding protein
MTRAAAAASMGRCSPFDAPRAVDANVSGYDALYLVLAEAADAPLVTADRRLAAAAAHVQLIA